MLLTIRGCDGKSENARKGTAERILSRSRNGEGTDETFRCATFHRGACRALSDAWSHYSPLVMLSGKVVKTNLCQVHESSGIKELLADVPLAFRPKSARSRTAPGVPEKGPSFEARAIADGTTAGDCASVRSYFSHASFRALRGNACERKASDRD